MLLSMTRSREKIDESHKLLKNELICNDVKKNVESSDFLGNTTELGMVFNR